MEQTLLQSASKEGIFALLFVCMLIYVLKEKRDLAVKSEAREVKLQGIIEELTGIIKVEICDLKEKVRCFIEK